MTTLQPIGGLLAAPPALAVAFGAVDVGYFATSFIVLYLSTTSNPATDWFHREVMFPSLVLREAAILALIVWAIWRMVGKYRLSMNNEQ